MKKLRTKVRHFFTTKEGEVVIGQFPNATLFVAAFFYFLTFWQQETVQMIGSWGLRLSLLYWSYCEIRYGVNSWRKLLGWLVLTYLIFSWIVG